MPATRTISLRHALDAIVSVVMVVAAIVLVSNSFKNYRGGRAAGSITAPEEPLSIDGAPFRGNEKARYVVVMFSDFECPFCRRFTRQTLPEIVRRYISTGDIRLVYRHLPLPNHPHAISAAISAECAGQQGRFWQMHDQLFAAEKLDVESFGLMAKAVEIDLKSFAECVEDAKPSHAINESSAEAAALGISGTPAFLLGIGLPDGRVAVREAFSGALPVEEFAKKLDALLGRRKWIDWWN